MLVVKGRCGGYFWSYDEGEKWIKNLGGRISVKCPVEHRPMVEGS